MIRAGLYEGNGKKVEVRNYAGDRQAIYVDGKRVAVFNGNGDKIEDTYIADDGTHIDPAAKSEEKFYKKG